MGAHSGSEHKHSPVDCASSERRAAEGRIEPAFGSNCNALRPESPDRMGAHSGSYSLLPLQLSHCVSLAPRLRQADKEELWASHHRTDMEPTLIECMERSLDSWAWLVDGLPVCAFGVAPFALLSPKAVPWMLGSEELRRHALPFLKGSRVVVDQWRGEFEGLENYVDARNVCSKRWLKWLGFTLEDAAPFGPEGMPFHKFWMNRERGNHV